MYNNNNIGGFVVADALWEDDFFISLSLLLLWEEEGVTHSSIMFVENALHWSLFVPLLAAVPLLPVLVGVGPGPGAPDLEPAPFRGVPGVVPPGPAAAALLLLPVDLLQLGLEHEGGDAPEHLVHVDVLLGGGLEEGDVVHLAGEPAGVLRDDHLPLGVVALVADEHPDHVLAVLVDLVQPPAKEGTPL